MAANRNLPSKQDILNHYDEYIDEINETVGSLLNAIKTGVISNANEYLPKSEKKNGQAKRPPNSNILCSNQLMNFGVRKIAKNICEKHDYNKQRIMVISRQFTGRIWQEKISDDTKKYFDNLAHEVNKLHKLKYPGYKLVKSKRRNKKFTIKQYDTTTKVNKPRRGKNLPVKNKAVSLPSEDAEVEDEFPSDQVVMPLSASPPPRSDEDEFASDQVGMSFSSDTQLFPEYFSPLTISKVNQQTNFPTSFPLPNQSSIQPVASRHNVQISNPQFNFIHSNIQTWLTPTYSSISDVNLPTFETHPSPSPLCEDQIQNIEKYNKYNAEILSSIIQQQSSYTDY